MIENYNWTAQNMIVYFSICLWKYLNLNVCILDNYYKKWGVSKYTPFWCKGVFCNCHVIVENNMLISQHNIIQQFILFMARKLFQWSIVIYFARTTLVEVRNYSFHTTSQTLCDVAFSQVTHSQSRCKEHNNKRI